MFNMYEYLENQYGKNVPILLSDIKIEGINDATIRQAISRLEKKGVLKKYDTGVYYMPKQTITKESYLSFESVIERKYITDGKEIFGFFGGMYLKNRFNITTQVPNDLEIITNETSSRKRMITLGGRELVLRMPKVEINKNNVLVLEFLELIGIIEFLELMDNLDIIAAYVIQADLKREVVQSYLKYYPNKISRYLIESGLIYVFAS